MGSTPGAGFDRTWKWAAKTAWGYPFNFLKNVIEHVFGYTHFGKKVSAGTAGAVHAAIASVVAGSTTTTGFTNPDVPRVLAATFGGTTNDFAASTLTITGTNVEGKTITDVLTVADNQTGQVVGSLVFKTVTSVALSKADGTGGTYTIDTTNKLGLVHRLQPSFATAIVIQDANVSELDTTRPTVQAAPAGSNFDDQLVEKNWVQPATTPDGTTSLYFFYWMHKVKVQPPTDSPDFYSTTTSTSISTSSTSTSSTSLSTTISTSSTSVSSTSTSVSSTSTSTTTLPV